uniref:Large ribosomal subunit protein bL19c n=1 Tax=Spyridia filamentosa TaxID=196632 RepID=A0A1Z1MJR0_SPYFI|nr:ribosomal protein L19 [Spyridia filamentosa]ARW66288.1 ribosomal protein L19 [Spyridia filamentosa]
MEIKNIVNDKKSIIQEIEKKFIKNDIPNIEVGDNIKIQIMIQEGNKKRIQASEGLVIAKKNSGINQTITVRKVLHNIGVEKIYLLHSPNIISINILRKSKVKKAKLYYIRHKSGKETRLKEKI